MASPDVTRLLHDLEAGDRAAFDVLLRRVYDELRVVAHAQLRRERRDHTLDTTALVHEAYIKLADQQAVNWKSRAHFFGAAAGAMRRILVDYARARNAQKRQGEHVSLTLAGAMGEAKQTSFDTLIEVDDALRRLAEISERAVQVVECRYFVGLTIQETAEALGISHATVSEDWRFARAWLQRELGG